MIELQGPFVSFFGTDPELLAKLYAKASNAVQEAIVAVEQCGPHGCDYEKESELKLAQDQHSRRIEVLDRVSTELVVLALSVLRQT